METREKLRLGVNIDHVATLRNARGGDNPCPVRAALLAADAGADGITAHLREDRRHIRDADMRRLKDEVALPLNFEMAATEEMLGIALAIQPNACCLVPEKREEKTTEGGLDVAAQEAYLTEYCAKLRAAGIRSSLFIDPDGRQVEAAKRIGADIVELHTGAYAEKYEGWFEMARGCRVPSPSGGRLGRGIKGNSGANGSPHPDLPPEGEGTPPFWSELDALRKAAQLAHSLGLEVHAGHGLNFENVGAIAAMPEVVELNIGHFLMGEALFSGLDIAILEMRRLMNEARA